MISVAIHEECKMILMSQQTICIQSFISFFFIFHSAFQQLSQCQSGGFVECMELHYQQMKDISYVMWLQLKLTPPKPRMNESRCFVCLKGRKKILKNRNFYQMGNAKCAWCDTFIFYVCKKDFKRTKVYVFVYGFEYWMHVCLFHDVSFIKTELNWLEECIVWPFSFITFYAIIRRWMARKWIAHDRKPDIQASYVQFLLLTYKNNALTQIHNTLESYSNRTKVHSKNACQTHFTTKVDCFSRESIERTQNIAWC